MKKILVIIAAGFGMLSVKAQKPENLELKYHFNETGTHYFQVTFLNQVWLRNSDLLKGSLVDGDLQTNQSDIGLRRTRMQMFGQLTDHVFLYFQFGQNNFNSQYNYTSNRKQAAFIHDALCEYKVTEDNKLKLGGGLTIANGLSRFSQPSISSIMTTEVPVFAQATVDQTDLFSRKLSVYARGQIGHFDYRFSLSDPFPVNSNGAAMPAIDTVATFASKKHNFQQQGYVMYQFFDHENHTTPYMTGTYLGSKKIFNIAFGAIMQNNAMWHDTINGGKKDTIYSPMKLWCVESFLDMPLNKEKGTAISAYLGYFNTNYGKNYLRYNGLMNPATSQSLNAPKNIGSMYGNALPMFGTGNVIYSQIGYLCPKSWTSGHGQLLPYFSITSAKYDRLGNMRQNTVNLGVSWLLQGHKAKLSLDYQNRPGTVLLSNDGGKSFQVQEQDVRKNVITIQYQIFL